MKEAFRVRGQVGQKAPTVGQIVAIYDTSEETAKRVRRELKASPPDTVETGGSGTPSPVETQDRPT
jgi:hypothetical protein